MQTLAAKNKPKLLFFQWDHAPNELSSPFLREHMQNHVDCLSNYFRVVLVNHDCDYDQICTKYEPDLALFESGYRSHGSRRTRISNTHRHPDVPKLGFHNGDAWCDRRSSFLSDMDHLGIEFFFTISVLFAEYNPGVRGRSFYWPNFIDSGIYKDYLNPKSIPIMITGQQGGLYPWRRGVYAALTNHFPCLLSPSFTYENAYSKRVLYGESYARALNTSWFAPTCGTMGKEIVRKHFEIPGCRACLITERTTAVEAAGFRDMENCIFAEATDVVDRVEHLMTRPDELARITNAGFDLVHSHHTMRQRSQILDWFNLNRTAGPNQRIVQRDPFGSLALMGEHETQPSWRVSSHNSDRSFLRKGTSYLWAGDIQRAESAFQRCLQYVSYLPEANFWLAMCSLKKGAPAEAKAYLVKNLDVALWDYGARDPDPVEWAYFVVTLLCLGEVKQALICLRRYDWLCHPELERVRRLMGGLVGGASGATKPNQRRQMERPSIHQLPELSAAEWREMIGAMLTVSGQYSLAQRLLQFGSEEKYEAEWHNSSLMHAEHRGSWFSAATWLCNLDIVLMKLGSMGVLPSFPPVKGLSFWQRAHRLLARRALAMLGPLGAAARRSASRWVRGSGPAW
jgi:tetratricopeptide (TPR) repeat protein